MSIYKELNEVQLDISEIKEIELSIQQQKRIFNRAKKEIPINKPKKKWIGASLGAVAALLLSLSLTIEKETIANMPFIGEKIENLIKKNEAMDYSPFKTSIGETVENALGKLTLNEVMLDDQQLFLSATFEPADNVKFDNENHLIPKIRINGEDYTFTTSASTLELNKRMFTIYNKIELRQAIGEQVVQLEITYDKWDFYPINTKIEQPLMYNLEVSMDQLLTKKKVYDVNKSITLNTGDMVTVQKVVTTPISTTIYYDLSESKTEDIYLSIRTGEGKVEQFSSAYASNDPDEVSYTRFDGMTIDDKKIYLIFCDVEGNQLDEASIPVN